MARRVKQKMFNSTTTRKNVILGLVMVGILFVFGIAQPTKANALGGIMHPDPGRGTEPLIPAGDEYTLNLCVFANGGASQYSPGFDLWLSDRGIPSQTVINNVPSGTASVQLDYQYAGVVCRSDKGAAATRNLLVSASPGISSQGSKAIAPNTYVTLPFGNFFGQDHTFDRGFYLRYSYPLTFSPPGGFTVSNKYTIDLYSRSINLFKDGVYQCVGGSAKYTNGYNFGPCVNASAQATITVNVIPPKPVNQAPQGSLPGNCTLTANFSDPDGPTFAEVRLGSQVIKSLSPGQSGTQIPVTGYTGFTQQTFDLWVADRQPQQGASQGNWVKVASSQPAGPCGAALSCNGATSSPAEPEPGTAFTVSAFYNYSGGSPPSPVGQALMITGPGYSNTWTTSNGLVYSQSSTGLNGTMTLTTPNITVPSAGTYQVNWVLTSGAVTKYCNGSLNGSPPVNNCTDSTACTPGHTCTDATCQPGTCINGTCGSFDAAFKPYMQAFNGDVVVGGGVPNVDAAGKPDCTPANTENQNAGIVGWNTEAAGSTDAARYAGAGSQYGARALNDIFDFASSYTVISGSGAGRPVALSFANTVGNFGGGFKGAPSGSCNAALVNAISSASATVVSGNQVLSSILSTANIMGTHTVYVKNGNVLIDQNVTYANTGGYGSISQIPSFKLVVLGGDISISSNVSQLDGSYSALPTTTTGGSIYTCSNGAAPYGKASAVDTAVNYDFCRQQLVVNGSLVAKQVLFLRSCGTLAQSVGEALGPVYSAGSDLNTCSGGNHAAEVINLDPETWLAPETGNSGVSNYDAVQNLPPVL
jgi:hypothetical protein